MKTRRSIFVSLAQRSKWGQSLEQTTIPVQALLRTREVSQRQAEVQVKRERIVNLQV